MRRFLVPVFILALSLLLSACGGKAGPNKQSDEWGNLQVTLEKIQQAEKQWSANLAIKNPSNKIQTLQYRGPFKYSLVITKEGAEVLRQDFETMDPSKPEILNLAAGVTKNHFVVWTFRDSKGERVAPGTYEASVMLHAVTVIPNPSPKRGEPLEQLVEPKTVGPVKITVK